MTSKALKQKIIAARIYPSEEVVAIVAEELERLADPKMIKQAVAKLDAMSPAQIAALLKQVEKEEGKTTAPEPADKPGKTNEAKLKE